MRQNTSFACRHELRIRLKSAQGKQRRTTAQCRVASFATKNSARLLAKYHAPSTLLSALVRKKQSSNNGGGSGACAQSVRKKAMKSPRSPRPYPPQTTQKKENRERFSFRCPRGFLRVGKLPVG